MLGVSTLVRFTGRNKTFTCPFSFYPPINNSYSVMDRESSFAFDSDAFSEDMWVKQEFVQNPGTPGGRLCDGHLDLVLHGIRLNRDVRGSYLQIDADLE